MGEIRNIRGRASALRPITCGQNPYQASLLARTAHNRTQIISASNSTKPQFTTTTANMPKDVKQKSGLIVGLNAGHKVTPRTPAARISRRRGLPSKRTTFVREITREVAGLAPYEKRVIELLRNAKDKRARRLAKKRLGTFGRAKRKVEEMSNVIAESRRAGHH